MTGIAIVGRGAMGSTHARAVVALGRAEQLKYVVTRTHGGLTEVATAATVTDDFELVLSDPDVEVISICTPTGTHRELATQALRAGKHVLLEKPVALTMDDARAIQQEALRSGTVFMVAQVVRFFAGYRQLSLDSAGGKLGTILSARATRASSKPEWAEWLRGYVGAGGMLVDFGIHDFDQMNLLLGEPVEVTATGTAVTGPVETTISYRDGGIGQVLSFADAAKGVPFRSSIEATGTHGFAHYEYSAATVRSDPTSPTEFTPVSHYSLAAQDHSTDLHLPAEEPYARQIEYFLQCVASGAEPVLCSTSSALTALRVALAATESLETRRAVRIHAEL